MALFKVAYFLVEALASALLFEGSVVIFNLYFVVFTLWNLPKQPGELAHRVRLSFLPHQLRIGAMHLHNFFRIYKCIRAFFRLLLTKNK